MYTSSLLKEYEMSLSQNSGKGTQFISGLSDAFFYTAIVSKL
jgi:hypothetical protein